MPKLDPEKQLPLIQQTLAHVLAPYGLKSFACQPMNKGIENTSVLIESGSKKYVLRIYRRDKKTDADIALELEVQDYLRLHGIPVPLILKNKDDKELNITEIDGIRWQSILMEYVEGAIGAPYTQRIILDLSTLQAKMHLLGIKFTAQNPPSFQLNDLREPYSKGLEIGNYSAQVQQFIGRARDFHYSLGPQLPSGYNHLDLDMGGNVIVKDGVITGIVDFDDMAYSPCVIDLGYTLWDILFDAGEDEIRNYLKNYQRTRLLTPAEREAIPHCMLFRNYIIGTMDLLMGIDAEIPKILQLEKEIPLLRI